MKLTLFLNLSFLALTLAKTVTETLEITRGLSAPDCQQRETLLVNGKFSGPELRFNTGDSLTLILKNRFDGDISIHLHGITQFGTVQYDGASGVTQLALGAGEDQQMITVLDRPGTFMYHAHHELYDLHVYGALIVEGDRDALALRYDEARVLVFSDYWRQSPEQLISGLLTTPNFTWIGNADAFLTNGNTIGSNCTVTNYYSSISVESSKKYRIRLVAATTLYIGYFSIQGHQMTIVEVEGDPVEPMVVDYVELMPGQRYSVIVEMDKQGGEYQMKFEGRYRTGGPNNGISILKYSNITMGNGTVVMPGDKPGWVNKDFKPRINHAIPSNPNPPVILEGRQVKYGPGGTQRRWTVNNISFEFPSKTSLLDTFKTNSLDSLPISQKPLARFSKGEVVDFVFQNTRALNGVCEVHPWHVHGHSFIPISSGTGKYPEGESPLGGISRDTIGVYGDEGKDYCGWTRIRFVANNVGVWAIHCHIISHYAMGMGGAFVVEEGVLSAGRAIGVDVVVMVMGMVWLLF